MNIYCRLVIIFFFLNTIHNLIAQDSLYLIGTLQGENKYAPIFNIHEIGDINSDGYDDFITCVPKRNYCKIYLGSNSFDLLADIILKSPPEIYDFGFFQGDVGDVNKDGYDDFILQGKRDSTFFIGQIFLYFGGEQFDSIPSFNFHDYFIQDALGSSISGGDVNGDGFSDFIIGNPYNWTNGIGRTYLFLGREDIVDTNFITFISDNLNDFFGDNVSLDGDINNDGFDDILISAPNINGNPNLNSKVFVYHGDTTLENTADTILNYTTPYNKVNTIYIPDFNGDGYDDFYITTENILFLGSSNFSFNNYLLFSNSEELSSFGATAGSGGDINNDGFDDLIIGATNHKNKNEIMVGGAYLFLGGVQPDTIPDYFIEGETKWSSFGKKVGTLGDINGDGFDEIYVLADGYPDSENPLGKVYIYSMKKFLVNVEEENQTNVHHSFKLFQNYPNPFNPSTKIKYALPYNSDVEIKIYDIMGSEIRTIEVFGQTTGYHEIMWNGENNAGVSVASGIYIYTLKAISLESNLAKFSGTSKFILLK